MEFIRMVFVGAWADVAQPHTPFLGRKQTRIKPGTIIGVLFISTDGQIFSV
jgi:hypothetical protein